MPWVIQLHGFLDQHATSRSGRVAFAPLRFQRQAVETANPWVDVLNRTAIGEKSLDLLRDPEMRFSVLGGLGREHDDNLTVVPL